MSTETDVTGLPSNFAFLPRGMTGLLAQLPFFHQEPASFYNWTINHALIVFEYLLSVHVQKGYNPRAARGDYWASRITYILAVINEKHLESV